MAWIESNQELGRHPKTKKLARILSISMPEAVGYLHFLWWWALDFAQDGSLSRYDEADIADAVMWDKDPEELFLGLVDAGFIERTDDGCYIHDWDDYAGRLLEKRRTDAERKRTVRGKPTDKNSECADIQRTSNGRPADGAGNRTLTVPNSTVPKEESTNVLSKKAQTHFEPPSVEQVAEYCQLRKNEIDPQKFWDYFAASDWVDSKGQKVRNWKQKIITWEGRNNQSDAPPGRQNGKGNIFAELAREGAFDD